MLVRKARPEDYRIVAAHILLAMDQLIYVFIADHSKEKALSFMETMVMQKGNQYSYENCWVAEEDNLVLGTAVVYDGGHLDELRKPVAKELHSRFGVDFNPGDETQAGEYYIDCIGVSPEQQGRGIGSELIRFLIHQYVEKRNETLGLLVERKNPKARELYLRLGFEDAGEKQLAGKMMDHLQYHP